MRAIAQHHQPARMLYDLALIDCTRHVKAIIAVDHDLDAGAFATTPEQHDRVATPRSHFRDCADFAGKAQSTFLRQGGGALSLQNK